MKDIKLILLVAGVILPIVGFALFFVNYLLAISMFILAALSFFAVFILIIIDRIKEKEEDKKNDYSNY